MPIPSNIVVVIAAFNEAATIRAIVEEALGYASTLIVVDDGSTDATAAQLAALSIVLLRNEVNQGKAACLRRGFQQALQLGADAVITLDADGQHLPRDIPRLISAWQQYNTALVLGARVIESVRVKLVRGWWNKVGDFLISMVAGHYILDTQSGFRCYPRAVVALGLTQLNDQQGFVFESAILIVAARQSHEVVEMAIPRIYVPGVRASYFKPWRDSARIGRMVWQMLWRYGFTWKAFCRALRGHGVRWVS